MRNIIIVIDFYNFEEWRGYEIHFKSNAHTAKNQSNLFIQVNFHITSFSVLPLASMTHFQRLGSFLMPSSKPLEFSSRICLVMAKFRSFKVGKQRSLNRSFNFMAGTHVWRIRVGAALLTHRSPEEWST